MKYLMKAFFIVLCFFFTSVQGQQNHQTKLPDWTLGPFTRPAGVNPIISPDSTTSFISPIDNKRVNWEANDTFNPGAVVKNGKVVVLYRAEDRFGEGIGKRTSRIGYAESSDGIHFTRRKAPVLYPANDSQKDVEWPGGCEDPRVAVTSDGTYVIVYTQWNRKNARLAVATSRDLINWTKHGAIFKKAYGGKFYNIWSKSASIVTKIEKGKQVIARINGKYWMYWGESNVYLATSTDLVNWDPLVDDKGDLKVLIAPRKGYFDSSFTECGPPAIVTKKGILLIYNGKNAPGSKGDTTLSAGIYSAGQLLFDITNPAKVLGRLEKPFFKPTEAFEKRGQYAAGTVFTQGLVWFKEKWYLYYGCADSRVAVAVFDPRNPGN
ncbi:putative GH43/DUF377 family glycosyl hydrolase [Arcticibacter tournemirensis]|uniref:Pesticidal protein Cry15Aa n=2 Tax=Arcticibacter tournemirensis TaxID=699437 RepID=A0A5M9GMW9_9SPHI|nr:hypothetical protein F1649_20650 [Arcticibacter tournemirensis]TQM50109.1 putative GH43/DUF377 family glycosyl hydrolase [Arcticibacter tournemirensis]